MSRTARFFNWLGNRALQFSSRLSSSNDANSQLAKNGWMGGRWEGGLFGMPPAAGIGVTQDSAMTVSTVYACTQARSETLASLPPMVYKELSDNIRRRDSNNQVWQLLHDQPNPHIDSMTFWELMQMRIVNRGFGAAEIVRDRYDRPIELWPIHNSRLPPYRDRNNNIIWRVYTDPSPTSPLYDGRPDKYRYYEVPDRDMFNIPGFSNNGIIGTGVIPMATEEISLALAMTQYGSSWFGEKGGKPAGVFEHPGFENDPEKRTVIREDLNNIVNGRENWHQSLVLWDGIKYKEIQVDPEKAQFLETVEIYPSHVVDAWLGHSTKVAEAHYLQVTPEHWERASGYHTGYHISPQQQHPMSHHNTKKPQQNSSFTGVGWLLLNGEVTPMGFEPMLPP